MHPKLTGAVMDQLESENEELRRSLDEALSAREEEKLLSAGEQGRLQELEEERARLDAEREQLTSRCAALEKELESAKAELAERASTAEQLARFEKQLEGAETMKRNYEERIKRLRARISQLQQSAPKSPAGYEADELLTIDMTAPAAEPPAPPREEAMADKEEKEKAGRKTRPAKDDTDWYESLFS